MSESRPPEGGTFIVLALGAVGLFIVATFVAIDLLPDPIHDTCSCAYRNNCEVANFYEEDKTAYCAFWGERLGCCEIISVRG